MNQVSQEKLLRKNQIASFKENWALSELDARMSTAKTIIIENEFKQMDYYLKARALREEYVKAIEEDRAKYQEAQKKAEEDSLNKSTEDEKESNSQ